MDLQTFQEICKEKCGLEIDQPVLLAFSGGADSLSLLLLLHNSGYAVVAAHFNHHLREESDADESAAAEVGVRLGIPFTSGGGDVISL
ncbi:MAG TPA: ATP-binding protein, partial [Leptolinea sp.]